MDWQSFKEKKIAVKCTSEKEKFFSDCIKNNIHIFLSEQAKKRDFFVCSLCYVSQFSEGRYELTAVDEWQVKPKGLFGNEGLQIVDYV